MTTNPGGITNNIRLGITAALLRPNINGTGQVDLFHSMKGPMTTQTLRGMVNNGSMHWRGDRATGFFGTDPSLFGASIPICGSAGDQQAATIGQGCLAVGETKATFGTGAFILTNSGDQPLHSRNQLLATVLCQSGGRRTFALEGSVFVAGSLFQWLRDSVGVIVSASESELLARSVSDSGGVYMVPALTGLGAPHWDQYARGTLVGLTRGSGRPQIARAALEGIAYQVQDVLHAMEADAGVKLKELRVDGGACANNLLMQFQSDILKVPVTRPKVTETTALDRAFDTDSGAQRADRGRHPLRFREPDDATVRHDLRRCVGFRGSPRARDHRRRDAAAAGARRAPRTVRAGGRARRPPKRYRRGCAAASGGAVQ